MFKSIHRQALYVKLCLKNILVGEDGVIRDTVKKNLKNILRQL